MPRRQKKISRRSFVGGSSAALALTIIPRRVLGGPRYVAPSDQINIAIVGCGGQGRVLSEMIFKEKDARISVVCDPVEKADYSRFYYKGWAGRAPVKALIETHYSTVSPGFKCSEYEDFRVMFEKELGIDAVVCAAPDHQHAVISLAAMRSKKHVYCEKPLSHNIREARLMKKVAGESGVATQMGNAGRSGEEIRRVAEWIRAGVIGNVLAVHAWASGKAGAAARGLPQGTMPVPPGMNWDLWLGPRAARPYHSDYAPFTWRGWWAFGGGNLGDMGCHVLDPAYFALDLKPPFTVEAMNSELDVDTERTPNQVSYAYKFPRDGTPLKLTWYGGGSRPSRGEWFGPDEPIPGGDWASMFIGKKGAIVCPWKGRALVFPEPVAEIARNVPKSLPRSKGHLREWLDACKGGPAPGSNFNYAAGLTELVHLGNVALRAEKILTWDALSLSTYSDPAAEPFINGSYRPGWELT